MAQESRLVIVIDSQNAERNARNLGNELDSIERKGDFATKSMDALSVATRQLAGYMAGLVTVSAAISKMDTYTGLQNRLKLVTSSQVELNKATEDTFRIAQKTYSAWDSVLQVYQRFSDNAKTLNLTMDDTARLTETVSKAVAISGASAEAADAALVQFGQALASGTLRGEELNSVMEQTPALAKAIAKGMGITVGELRSVAAEGKITSQEIVKALRNVQDEVDALFAKTDITIGQSLTLLNNEITKFVGEAGKGSGAAQALSGSIQLLANNLNLIADSAFAIGIGLMTKAVLTKTVAVQASIAASTKQVFATIAERNANIAAAKAEVESALAEAQSTQVTLTNIKATHAQIMAEIELEKVRLKAQITEQGRTATITRMAQLGRLQAQVALEVAAAETAQSASSARLSAALTAQSVATSRLALAKSALMAFFSPMGLAIAATAASFYLLSSSSDEVKESLATQSDSVSDLTDKYIKLNTVQALTEGVRLRKEIEQQNDAIDDASGAIKRFAYIQKELFKLSGSDYEDYQNAIKSIATGASDAGDLLKKMISSGRFSQTQIDKLIEFSSAVAESKNKIEQGNTALKLLNATSGQHVEVTAESIKQLTIQTNLTKVATQNFTDMKTQMLDSLRAQVEFIRLNGGSEEQVKSLNKVIQAYSLNQISATDAVSKFNSTAKVPVDNIKKLQEYAIKTDQSKIALNQANAELKKQNDLRNEYLKQHQTVLGAQQGETNELNNQVAAQEKLNKLRDNANKDNLKNDFLIKNTKAFGGGEKGLDKARAASEFYTDNKIPMTRSLTGQEYAIFEAWYKKQKEVKDLQESISESTRKQTKEVEKQTKESAKQAVLLAGNNERVRNMLRVYQSFRNAGLGDKQARVMTAQVGRETDFRNEAMFGSHKDANNGYTNTGFLSWQKSRSTKLMQSLQGQGVLDKNGKIQQTQDALDAMAKHAVQEAMTDKSYSKSKAALLNDDLDYRSLERIVAKNFVGWDYDGKKLGKAKASQHLAKQDSYYNQLSKILGDNPEAASKAIGDLSKFEDEAYKARAKTLEEVKQLQATYDSETVARSKKREEEINKATILGQSNLIPKINERYDAEDKLAQKQFDFEVNGYKWTEEQKLDYTYETNSLRLVAEGKLSEDQRKVALDGLKLQKQQELGLLKLAQEQRLFQARLSLLSETQAMQERYRLEREEILKNTKLSIEERQKLIALSKATQEKETRDKVNNAVQNWGGIQADMNGTSEFFRQDQERFSRLNAANDLADSQYAATDLDEKNGLDNLNAQMEAGLIKQQDFENRKTAIIQAAQDQRNQIAAEYAQNAQDIEDKYQQDRLNTQIAFGGQMMGSLTSMFGSMFGEQSKAYKIMFAADKAYAIAAAGIAIQQNIAAASKAGFPLNIPLIAGAVAQGASIIANIRAIKDQGFADGGYTGSGGKYEPAGIVHKGEVVWSQEDIRRWGGVGLVENMRKSANPEAFINNHAQNNTSIENVFNRSFLSSKAFNDNKSISNISNLSNSKVLNSNVSNSTVQNAEKELLKEVSIFKDNGFADGGYTGKGKKYEIAGAVHKGEIVWSQDDIKKWGGVDKVEQMRRATSPESFVSNYAQNHTTFESILNRANQSSRIFNQSKEISNIFNQSVQDDQIIYKGNGNVPTSATSDLYHDGKVYFSSNGLVQDRSNLEDVQDFTISQASRPQAEIMPSIEPSTPTINFKIEVINQVSGATVEAEQLDEQTVRIIVTDELDKQLPRKVPKLVSDQIGNPNSTISRSLTENTTARRNRT
ncbi:TPA: tape measure protein [Acinetobacter baumannii]|uniref:tape measure protein n=2 Tax=Acinetobacter baumannii TaxID=470 RepID=UPI000FEC48E3|nr:tape measure protein [Acinetobacter baumannii]QAB41216.1 phage tail protein [Acinetobacter baumannii]HAV4964357.1 phage tail protein [Acinetobacter baumannii]HCT3679814.1 tape measure protein [Acinetobacter baumannii]